MPEFTYKNKKIEYTLSRNAKKYINFRIKQNGEVHISVPKRITKAEIEKMLYEKAEWIITNQIKVQNRKQNKINKDIHTGNHIYLNGNEYIIKVIPGTYNHVYIHNIVITIQIKESHITSQTYINSYFESWLKENTYSLCNELIDKYLIKLDNYIKTQNNYTKKLTNNHLLKPTLTIRNMTSRWGSCTPSKNQITINKNLIYPPQECLEYVVLHELSHLLEANHSKNFYKIIENIMPDWKEKKNKLNNF